MDKKEKLIKVAGATYKMTKALYIFACVVCLVGVVLAIVLPLTVKNVGIAPMELCAMFIYMALVAFFVVGVLWNFEMICKSIKENGSLFTERLPKYIRKIGIITILASIIPSIVATAVIQSTIPDSEMVYSVGIGGVVCGAVFILMGVFFKYGAELQRKDDETL